MIHLSMLVAGCDVARADLAYLPNKIPEVQLEELVKRVWLAMERKRVMLEPVPLNTLELEALAAVCKAFDGSCMNPVGLFAIRDRLKPLPVFENNAKLVYAALGMLEQRGLIQQPTNDGEPALAYFPTSKGRAAMCLAKGDAEGVAYWATKPATATVATVVSR